MAIDFKDPEVLKELKEAGLMSQEDIKAAGYMTSTDVLSAGYVKPEDVDQRIKEANAALETNKNDILAQLKAEKDAKAELISKTAGIDLEKARELLNKVHEDEISAMATSGDIDGLKKRFTADLESKLADLQGTVSTKEQEKLQIERDLKEQIAAIQSEAKQVDIKREVNTAMQNIRDQIQPTAFSEIERDALELFDYDDDKNLVIKDSKGVVQVTEDGNLSASGWLKKMINDKPHRFTGASGGGNPPSSKAPVKDGNGKELFGMARLAEKRKRAAQG